MPSTSAPRNEFGLSEATMDIIRGICGRFPRVSQVIMYGSRAMGTFREGSDIDMTVIADEGFTQADLLRMADAFDDSPLPYLVDLSIFTELKSPELKDHIRRRGKVLYKREAASGKEQTTCTTAR
ncbi:MAG: nucleotidyltransferase domain-containing protein [Treponemataceae bacterium]|nr:nucleotidyltransferase domain-containing protein [Treponemataceae bacterium]